jgi:hypothetical protein
MSVPYGRYEESFKAIHSALSDLMAAPSGKRTSKIAFTWNPDGTLAALGIYEDETLLFTLDFTWNADGSLKEVSRTDA